MKKAIVTGVTGQDGSYLAEMLLHKGYEVHGVIRRASTFNTRRLDHIYKDPHNGEKVKLYLHYGDLSSSDSLERVIHEVQPDEAEPRRDHEDQPCRHPAVPRDDDQAGRRPRLSRPDA